MKLQQDSDSLREIDTTCRGKAWEMIWLFTNVLIIVIGGTCNGFVIWLTLRESKANNVTKVLGLNVAVMDFLYISFLPFACYLDPYSVATNFTGPSQISYNIPFTMAESIFSMFNLIGCPLLLACMCIERYLAVARPVLYLKARKWEYRAGVSAAVWALTFCFCLVSGIINNLFTMLLPICVVIANLFFVMFASLTGVILSLRRSNSALTGARQGRSGLPLKRRAVVNVLTVVVPAVVAYMPVCVMLPLLFLSIAREVMSDLVTCFAVQFSQLFPKLGVFIGPLFYFAKAKRILMCGSVQRTEG